MKTIGIKLYTFEELTEQAQQYAINDQSDINVDFYWCQGIYNDASDILLKIESFDIEKNEIEVRAVYGHTPQCIADMILKNHGKDCNTYHLAQNLPNMSYEDFMTALSKEYLKMLTEDYEFRTMESTIKETLIENDYYFTADGKLATDLENQDIFLNGFDSWYETHHEVVAEITRHVHKDTESLVMQVGESQGTGGLYELAEKLTWKFEKLNKDREWDGEFFDEIEDFLATELKPE